MKKLYMSVAAILSALLILSACTDGNGSYSSETTSEITEETRFTVETTAPGQPQEFSPAESTVEPWNDTIPNICSSRYGYYTLNASEKAVYDTIFEAARRFEPHVEIERSISKQRLEEICEILYLEETSIYYLSKEYSVSFNAETGEATAVDLSYNYDYDEVKYMNTMTEEHVREILSKVTGNMSDVDKIKLFHDEIVLGCRYSVDAKYAATPYGVFVDGEALCEGYARAFALLCNKVGIENLFATGTQNFTDESGATVSEEHIWNMVKIDGLWYNIDMTWDDPTASKNNQALADDYISYSYCLVPRSELRPTLNVDESLFALPEANSLESNYFVYYGYYATTYEEAEEILTKSIEEATASGNHYIRIKFSTTELYKFATNALLREGEIFTLCPGKLPDKLDFYWNETTRSIQLGL